MELLHALGDVSNHVDGAGGPNEGEGGVLNSVHDGSFDSGGGLIIGPVIPASSTQKNEKEL